MNSVYEKVIITYGTFDLFHVGHLRLLERLKSLGEYLIVGVSTDEFNGLKGKNTIIPFEDRCAIIEGLRCVDLVIPEHSWDQKLSDVKKYNVDIFAMGDDWKGKFSELEERCNVLYFPRTEGVSSTKLKNSLRILGRQNVDDLKSALDTMSSIIERLE
jgi:glycerol-3-phosphate cytidylyltransferase